MESGNLENPRCHVWAGARVGAHVCACPSRVSTSPCAKVAEDSLGGQRPCLIHLASEPMFGRVPGIEQAHKQFVE